MAPFLSHFENKILLKLNNHFSNVNPSEITTTTTTKNLEEMQLKL